ncbi:hypothetical protein PIB30_114539, partial [Stylosanthes scabra]|nr:hypothetical protein [Stylosanthes scabra]
FEAMTHAQPTFLTELRISNCSSAVSFPGDSLPPSLQQLWIEDCKNLEFPRQRQQHRCLELLHIANSCDSVTSFKFSAFLNLRFLTLICCKNLTSLEVSQSQSLQVLSIVGCSELETIRVPASLSELRINECQLLAEPILRMDPDIWLYISSIPHLEVDGERVFRGY